MIKVCLLDVDGVLINSEFSKILFKDYKLDKNSTKGFFKMDFKECLTGRMDTKEALKKHLKKWGYKAGSDRKSVV